MNRVLYVFTLIALSALLLYILTLSVHTAAKAALAFLAAGAITALRIWNLRHK